MFPASLSSLTLFASAPSPITPHLDPPEQVLQRMGAYYHDTLPFPLSASDITAYADNETSRRDIQTAENFLKGLLPAGGIDIHHNTSVTKWLFNQGGLPPAPTCGLPTEGMVLGSIGGSIDGLV